MIYKALETVAYIVLGCVIGVYFCNYEYFELDNSFEISDLVGIAVTSVIGLYIAKNLQKQQNSDRKEKDFIIEEVQVFRRDVAILNTDDGVYDFESIKSASKSINQRLQHIKTLLSLSSYNKKAKTDEVERIFKSLRRLILQNSPINNSISLTTRQKNLASNKHSELVKELYKLILEINNR